MALEIIVIDNYVEESDLYTTVRIPMLEPAQFDAWVDEILKLLGFHATIFLSPTPPTMYLLAKLMQFKGIEKCIIIRKQSVKSKGLTNKKKFSKEDYDFIKVTSLENS